MDAKFFGFVKKLNLLRLKYKMKFPTSLFLTLTSTIYITAAADQQVAETPPMGWLQWERYRCIIDCETYPNQCVNENLFKRMAERLISDGYQKAGYKYINIDDCWSEKERDEKGFLVADRKRFPNGIKHMAEYLHGKELKLGIYTDMGMKTCAGYPATMFYMKKDTETFASWGIDMIKLDGCNSCTDIFPEGHQVFGWYVNKTGRPTVYSCEWPLYLDESKPKPYAAISKVCNLWRNWNDVQDSWQSVVDIINYNGDHQDEIIPYVGPGRFNDIDMLLIGDYSLSVDQSKAQFAMWAILTAPLFISADLENMQEWQKEILLNEEVIAVDQDPLGKMGRRIHKSNVQQTWFKTLSDDSVAVVMMSLREANPVYMEVVFTVMNITGPLYARDLYAHRDLGSFNTSFKAMVNPSGVVMIKLSKHPLNI